MLSFCGLEAHVNAVATDFSSRPELSEHERGLLLEKEVRLDSGVFVLSSSLKMARLEDRIEFLQKRFSAKSTRHGTSGWKVPLTTATNLRNKLTHPKEAQTIGAQDVRRSIEAIIGTLDSLFLAVYGKRFPPARRGISSRLNF
jgi:hypothetical protein